MDHTIENVSELQRKVSLTVPAAGVNAMIDSAVRRFGADLALDGFRKGKVPAKVVEKRFPSEITDQATDALVNMQISRILEQENINPISRIQFDGGKVSRDEDFSFSFSFEVLPAIALPEDLSALSVEVGSPDLKVEDVDGITRRIRQALASLEEVTESRLPENGDVVLVDVDGMHDGVSVPGMKADNYMIQLREPKEGVKETEVDLLIRRLRAGEEGHDTMICPDDHPDPTLRGKTIDLTVRMKKIHKETLPDLDEEFAKKVGFEDLGKLRKAIFEQAMNNKLKEVKEQGQKKLLDGLLDALDFPLPESMVNAHLAGYLTEARDYLTRQGLPAESVNETLKNMRDEGLIQAKMQAKAQAFLTALAFRENIKVTEREADQQIMEMARESNQDFHSLRETLWQNGMINDIQERLMATKALDLLYNKAKKIVVGPDGQPLPPPEIVTGDNAAKAAEDMVADAE